MTRRLRISLFPVILAVAVAMLAACGQTAIRARAPGTWREAGAKDPAIILIKTAPPSKYGVIEYTVSYTTGPRHRFHLSGGEGASLHRDAIYLWGENRMSAPLHAITYEATTDQLLVTHWGPQGETVTFARARK